MWSVTRRFYTVKPLTQSLLNHLRPYESKYKDLETQVLDLTSNQGSPEQLAALQIKLAKIEAQASAYKNLSSCITAIEELEELKDQKEMQDMALEEIEEKEAQIEDLETYALSLLLPIDEDDSVGAILEIRPGVGGSESCLFAENLLEMYLSYAELNNWSSKIVSLSKDQQLGKGCKEAIIQITGDQVYGTLKCESGVHKVHIK